MRVSVSGSRRVDSRRAAVCRVSRRLRGAEDEEQEAGRHETGRERHDHDLAPHLVESVEDRDGVPPDAHDAKDLAAHLERQELPQDHRRPEVCRTGTGLSGGAHSRLGGPTAREVELAGGRGRHVMEARVARGHDRPVRPSQLDAEDLARARQRRELRLEARDVCRCWCRRPGQDVRLHVGVHERPDRCRVAPDHTGEGRGREVRTDEEGLGRRGGPDDRQERAVDQDQKHGPWRSRACAEQCLTMPRVGGSSNARL